MWLTFIIDIKYISNTPCEFYKKLLLLLEKWDSSHQIGLLILFIIEQTILTQTFRENVFRYSLKELEA